MGKVTLGDISTCPDCMVIGRYEVQLCDKHIKELRQWWLDYRSKK